ncbi:class I SAM-dependent methyltransferase [archaeon]|jgi:ubiquinone/menaquinone biosynthesis C-methylase UbiE|nr:class I SAM-dependent methyltransferase [archaeon]MBT3730371.1 class I SAM-dependent methyltransferase [archaeon]MBT4669921.1 class I SAM-dependent methyltransferase [archaeon]MBT7052670.1 class I SAM-dependent methyltransferase [archaeon]MBT7280860.1 class I SAM-dependent methyltransferase [archaeon]
MKNNPWDNFSKNYNSQVTKSGDIYHKTYLNPLVLKLLGDLKNKKVLDLACGNGYFSKILAKKNAKVTGVDYSKDLISIAKENSKINFLHGSSTNLHFFKNNSFDYIVSNMAFHDIKNISKTIKECSRVIKPKQKLIFSIVHPAFYLTKRIKEDKEYFLKLKAYMSVLELDHPIYEGIKHYHRPVGYYLKLLFKNKFVVSGFYEISTKHRKGKLIKEPKLLKYKQEFPTFLVIEATSIK